MTQNQSWKCPKCIEEAIMKSRRKKQPLKVVSKILKKPILSSKKKTNVSGVGKKKSKVSSKSSLETSDSDHKKPARRKSKQIKTKKVVDTSDSSSDDTSDDSSSDEENDKIIRIPVDKSELKEFYK